MQWYLDQVFQVKTLGHLKILIKSQSGVFESSTVDVSVKN